MHHIYNVWRKLSGLAESTSPTSCDDIIQPKEYEICDTGDTLQKNLSRPWPRTCMISALIPVARVVTFLPYSDTKTNGVRVSRCH